MKWYILIHGLLLMLPPKGVITTFNQMFPKANEIKWTSGTKQTFTASFVSNNEKQSATFDVKGNWIDTRKKVAYDLLPPRIKNTFVRLHPGKTVTNALMIFNKDHNTLFNLEWKDANKPVMKVYNLDGVELK